MIIDSLLSADGLAVLMAVLLGCFVKGALGFGLPLIATPIMLFVLPLPEIVAILALPITIANIQQIWLNRKQWQILKSNMKKIKNYIQFIKENTMFQYNDMIDYTLLEDNRIGDHQWYISDLTKFQNDYPTWPGITISLQETIKQMVEFELSKTIVEETV